MASSLRWKNIYSCGVLASNSQQPCSESANSLASVPTVLLSTEYKVIGHTVGNRGARRAELQRRYRVAIEQALAKVQAEKAWYGRCIWEHTHPCIWKEAVEYLLKNDGKKRALSQSSLKMKMRYLKTFP